MQPHDWVKLAAVYHIAIALFHFSFGHLFGWREDLLNLTAVNRGIIQVLNLMLGYGFLAFAALQLGWSREMTSEPLGRALLGCAVGFWVLRAILQPLFWRPTKVCWFFCGLFVVGAVLHVAALA